MYVYPFHLFFVLFFGGCHCWSGRGSFPTPCDVFFAAVAGVVEGVEDVFSDYGEESVLLVVRLGVGGWGLCMYAGLVFRGVSFGGRTGKEKKGKLTCKNENFPPWQYTTLPISSQDVCKSKSLP